MKSTGGSSVSVETVAGTSDTGRGRPPFQRTHAKSDQICYYCGKRGFTGSIEDHYLKDCRQQSRKWAECPICLEDFPPLAMRSHVKECAAKQQKKREENRAATQGEF